MADASLSPELWDKFGVLILQTSTSVRFQSCKCFLVSHLCLRHFQAWRSLDQNYCSVKWIKTASQKLMFCPVTSLAVGVSVLIAGATALKWQRWALVYKGSKSKMKNRSNPMFLSQTLFSSLRKVVL